MKAARNDRKCQRKRQQSVASWTCSRGPSSKRGGWMWTRCGLTMVVCGSSSLVHSTTVADLPYRYEFPTQYNIRLLADPCKYSSNALCCDSSYGISEYFEPIDPIELDISTGQHDAICQFQGAVYPVDCLVDADGNGIEYTDARTPDWTIALDPECKDEGDPRYDCYSLGTKRLRFRVEDEVGFSTLFPECIDNNDTVAVETTYCHSLVESGDENAKYCMDVAFAQNNFVFQCRGNYATDDTCGTFVEVHRPGDTVNDIISDVRVPEGLYSGYNNIVEGISLKYRANGSTTIDYVDQLAGGAVTQETMLLCKADYELWWVMRTRKVSIVQYIKPFRITSPVCDWDTEIADYLPYTLERNI